MIQLTNEQLIQLHKIQLNMLMEVRRICNKYHIKYSLIGGTLLGAIRHQGYIPWDDDADVGMLRKDYEKFRKITKIELDSKKYYFQDDRNTKEYRWGYGKLRCKNTLFCRENQEHLNFGQEVFIDIFPLDYVPDNMMLRIVHMFRCFCIRKSLWSPVGAVSEKKWLKRSIYKILSRIPKEIIFNHYYKLIKTRKKSNTVRINLFPTHRPYGFPKFFFEELKEVYFEGEKFLGTAHYDEYLRIKYGNYMKIPSKEQQFVHPVVAIKLE